MPRIEGGVVSHHCRWGDLGSLCEQVTLDCHLKTVPVAAARTEDSARRISEQGEAARHSGGLDRVEPRGGFAHGWNRAVREESRVTRRSEPQGGWMVVAFTEMKNASGKGGQMESRSGLVFGASM